MDLSGIISVAGMSGLYKVISQTKNGFVVESLLDKKRVPVYASQKISALDDISIFSTAEDVPLKDVFKKILEKEKEGPAIDHKSNDVELKKYFEEVLPEYDKDRVYTSDIKKVLNWYNTLQKQDLLKTKEEEKVAETEEKTKLKIGADEKARQAIKATHKDVSGKPIKTSSSKVKTQTVRKTGA